MRGLIAAIVLLSVCGASDAEAQTGFMERAQEMTSGSLAGMLESQLGVTQSQAEGGIGSILSLARERLDAKDFDRLAAAIPGAEGYIDTAKNLGAVAGPLSNVSDLTAALGRLGISPDMIDRFVPAVTDLVGKIGGDDARQLLASVLRSG